MLHSTMEVITQATSNSLFVFLVCNLIIVILLVSSVKPGSRLDEDSSSHTLPVVANKKKKNGKYINVEPSFEESKGLITASEVSNAQIASIDDGNIEDEYNNSCNTSRNNNNNSSGNSSNATTTTSHNNNSSGKNTTTTSGNNNDNTTTTTTSGSNNDNNNDYTTTTTRGSNNNNNNNKNDNTTTTTIRGSNNNNNNNNNDNNTTSGNNKNDGDNDELRRKVEQFIEKVNRGWRAENLRTHALVHIEKNPQPELTRIRAN